jgi:serine/threonine-protein kinase
VTRDGREEAIGAPARPYLTPRLSPDDARVALTIDDREYDVWTWDVARRLLTRLTFDPGRDFYPAWAPDGRRIFFVSGRHGVPHLFRRPADGTGSDEQLTDGPNVQFGMASFTPDGTRLVFTEVVPGTGEDVMQLFLEGTPRAEPLLQTTFAERNAAISPDGRWLAYESNEAGQEEIYVRPFPKVADGHWQISTGGGTDPVWARNGRELFYRDGSSVMAAAVEMSPTFEVRGVVRLFDGPYLVFLGGSFDVARDGRFLMMKEATPHDQKPASSLVVVVNWFEELKRLVPVK